jgi:KDO2-lipid IV(A) lauroyltransferase
MVRRLLNVRKALLRFILPLFRTLPLTLASRLIAGIGRTEYCVLGGLRRAYQAAVARANERLGCTWDIAAVSLELAGNQVRWRTRDLLLDGVADDRAAPMFAVEGRERLDQALAQRQGVILLTGHYGAHLLAPHWLLREGYPLRFYMERPRHVSKFLSRQFDSDGPLGQDKLFISRKGETAESASSILRAARVLKAGLILYLAGDVRWAGPHTEAAEFLGRTQRFSATWVSLAAMTGAAVVPVFCQMQSSGTYHIEYRPPFHVPEEAPKSGRSGHWVQTYLRLLEDQVRLHPANSNEYFFWPEPDDRAA